MKLGVYIDSGPQDWQILQQSGGAADIALSGRYYCGPASECKEPAVYARVVMEDSGQIVLPWAACHILPGGQWETVLSHIPAGGLYRIETCLNLDGRARIEWSTRGDMIHHVGVGDVFLIAGQSNSAGYGRDPIFDPIELGVHLLRTSGRWSIASHPMNDSTDTQHEANRENSNPGHSPYLAFAKRLKQRLGYPIGLVQAAKGGSALAEWNPDEDGALFRNALAITAPLQHRIKGVLWSQGCADAVDPACNTYLARFTTVVHAMRAVYGAHTPFLTIQINRSTDGWEQCLCWSMVQEAQRQAAALLPDLYVIPSNDLSLCDRIHNSSASNLVIGERLAACAIQNLYEGSGKTGAPDLKYATIEEPLTLALDFDHVYERLSVSEAAADELAIRVIDQAGEVSVASYAVEHRTRLVLKLARRTVGQCRVIGASGFPPKRGIPVDIGTYLPMLSFDIVVG